ncbi:MAG: ROK family protein [Ardenticatenaceae bacterium]|nr:ROK family protein [Ardenticatenaceae bacterium]
MEILGIDIGGSGIKGALVDTETGEFATERKRIATPQPATPEAVIKTVRKIVDHFEYNGPIGVGIPSVVIDGIVKSAANIDNGWIGYPGQKGLAEATGCPVTLLNDADVAAIAEMKFGAGHNHPGVVMVFTLGTGIGSAMFVHGRLVPNLELGHVFLRSHKKDAEAYASDRARQDKDLDWAAWGGRLNEYFQYIEALFSPQLVIIGGGVSKKHEKFLKYIDIKAEVVPAELLNQAGIVGAALAAISDK